MSIILIGICIIIGLIIIKFVGAIVSFIFSLLFNWAADGCGCLIAGLLVIFFISSILLVL